MRVEYRCLDGSPFPVVFADAADAERTWSIDLEHAPRAMTPLADAVIREGTSGAARAYEECGLRLPSSLPRQSPFAHGFHYFLEFELPPDEAAELSGGLARLAQAHGWTSGFWANVCVPQLRDECEQLRAEPAGASFGALAERRSYVWSLTGIAGIMARRDERAVAASLEPQFGERSTSVAYQLAQGHPNRTIAADESLIRLASLGADSSDARRARESYLREHGDCTLSWPIDHPTLREQPDVLDGQLRLLRSRGRGGVHDIRAEAIRRREQLVAEIGGSLRDADERATFERRAARLSSFVAVREARAHWQLLASGFMRAHVRERGRELVERGVIEDVDDVFLLDPAEYDGGHVDAGAIAQRRLEHTHWLDVTPPAVIGRGSPESSPRTVGGQEVVLGAPGAPGVARGRARVVVDLLDAERLEPGDVLVTTMTSPLWTPLFGIAAAVVTDSGDALSHVAIAAREYAIPCVVGTHHATVTIPDGAMVVVDGDSGTIRVAD